ncbi:MAG TPA: adenylate/guanylate cyclase domain-containing protein [Solirubrobacterales bacterium]|nr:adenylate/guanylate cyclase domain-containing protein [Solirubrobacterales bacterium]
MSTHNGNDNREEERPGVETAGSKLLLTAVRQLREVLPGDSRFGDTLSTGGRGQSQALGRRLAEATQERPSLLREAGLSALQVWDAISEGAGRDTTERELAIVFTDLVEFSSWAMRAGDAAALQLLRDVGDAIEPPVTAHSGEVVKRLGDGMMAAFAEPADGLNAVFEAHARLASVAAESYRPHIRAGMHLGYPRRIGGDYLGVDVNVAARIADAAKGDEMLVSDVALERIDRDGLKVRRKRFFHAKGVPAGVAIYSVAPK